MELSVTFKTPDVLEYALSDLDEETRDDVKEILSQWIEFSELVTIEFDTVAKTAVVKKVK